MSGPFTTWCKRCGVRPALQLKLGNTRAGWLYAAATNGTPDVVAPADVRLCSSCRTTVENLGSQIVKAKKRTGRTK